MTRPRVQTIAIAALLGTAVIAVTESASGAQSTPRILGLPIAVITPIVTEVVGGTVGGTVGGVITTTTQTVTDTVGSTVSGILDGSTVSGALGETGSNSGLLPADALGQLLGTLGITASSTPGTITNPDGSVTIDRRSPGVTLKVLSKLHAIKRDGRLKLQVASDEAGIVAFTSTVRPGRALKPRAVKGKPRKRAAAHSRKVIHVPAVTLGFRRPGALKVTVQLSRAAQRNLGGSRNARISVGMLAADAASNQSASRIKRTVAR